LVTLVGSEPAEAAHGNQSPAPVHVPVNRSASTGALTFLLGVKALRASEARRRPDRGLRRNHARYRVLHPVGKGMGRSHAGHSPGTPVLDACRGERTTGPLIVRPITGNPSIGATSIA
jgi:hypothetical protein